MLKTGMIKFNLPGPLVTTAWLAEHLFHPNLVVLDATMKPIGKNQSGFIENSEVQIPNSRIFDFDTKICDRKSPLPHMMPTAEVFEHEVRTLGVNQESIIIVYDRVGVYSGPRARWMFKAMGHENVAILDGGFPTWISEERTIEEKMEKSINRGNFIAQPKSGLICNADEVESALINPEKIVLDARSPGRFSGNEPEPREGLRSGHMPNAFNIPFNVLVSNTKMLPIIELAKFFSNINPKQQIIASCGSGVTACVVALAAELVGFNNIAIYDGSWCEWGLPSSRMVVK